jgi:SAM-dependent methyltransferase
MHPGEYEQMARVEESHWWYRGLRDVVARSLTHRDLAVSPGAKALDAGCGTGSNLKMLQELLQPSYLGGFDNSEEAVRLTQQRVAGADVYLSDICDPVIHVDQLDLILSLDVIYIPGVERSIAGLKRLVARLRPGGLLVLNLPAYNWLYSEHDVALYTSQRFTKREVGSLLAQLGLAPARLSYRLFFLLPALVVWRLPRILGARAGDPEAKSDLHREQNPATGGLLFRLLRAENAWIARGGSFPWGSSVFAIGRKV